MPAQSSEPERPECLCQVELGLQKKKYLSFFVGSASTEFISNAATSISDLSSLFKTLIISIFFP